MAAHDARGGAALLRRMFGFFAPFLYCTVRCGLPARYSCFKMSGADLISSDKRYLFGAPIFPARRRRTYDASTSPAAGGTKDAEAGDGVRTAGGSSEQTTGSDAMPRSRQSFRKARARGHTEVE